MVAIIVIAIVIIIALILFWLSYHFEQRKKLKARNACYAVLIILGVCSFVIAEKTCETIFHYNQATEKFAQVDQIVQRRADLLTNYSFVTNNDDNLQAIENARRYYYNQKAKYYHGSYDEQGKFFKHANRRLNYVARSLNTKHNEKLQGLIKKDKSVQEDYQFAIRDYSEHALDYNNLTGWSISYYLAQYFIKDKRHFPLLDPELIKEVKRAEHDRELTII